jgi:hypothetical protein
MNPRYPGGPPGNGNGARQGADPRTEKQLDCYTSDVKINRADRCLEPYVSYLTHEHERLGGGAIGCHYLSCITTSYRDFQASGSQKARFQTWVGIRVLCQWLSQLGRATS